MDRRLDLRLQAAAGRAAGGRHSAGEQVGPVGTARLGTEAGQTRRRLHCMAVNGQQPLAGKRLRERSPASAREP